MNHILVGRHDLNSTQSRDLLYAPSARPCWLWPISISAFQRTRCVWRFRIWQNPGIRDCDKYNVSVRNSGGLFSWNSSRRRKLGCDSFGEVIQPKRHLVSGLDKRYSAYVCGIVKFSSCIDTIAVGIQLNPSFSYLQSLDFSTDVKFVELLVLTSKGLTVHMSY